MKRHILIATAAAAALIAGGTATAVAVNGSEGPGSPQSGAQTSAQLAAKAGGTGADGRQAHNAADGRSSIPMQDHDEDGQEDVREAAAAKVSAPQAAAAALKAVPGTVTGLDLDADRPGLVWDVDQLGKDGRWHELTLDAGNARVLNQHVDHEDDDHGQGQVRSRLKGATTDAAGAARTAAAGHGTVTSVDLDDDHRAKAVWEVETVTKDGKEHDLLVDPQSGALTAAPAHGADDDDNGGQDD
ncbi:PepSY domain-containing protein [Streptomyces pinistramenti]|uniref:PepSY domain-containing protein n=1 Tax=Streptomyces pinistramenti TaxID=2884812 RepID=UPI001D0956BB|nr:PepSY domain-containing protein [Streptomyces pinistramenti]MCB5911938.1 PepSY domain-containing protein [Streptomyces pinistramenti]